MTSILAAAAAVDDERSAESLLAQMPSPEALEAVARRADEIRFEHPEQAVGVARTAVRAIRHLPAEARGGSLAAVAWAIYGSVLRNVARLQEAEAALLVAARFLPSCDTRTQAEIARRLASLRAEQRRPGAVRALLPAFLAWGEQAGGQAYGEELVNAGSMLIRVNDFAGGAKLTELSLLYLSEDDGRFYISAVYNIAICRLELAATDAELNSCIELVNEASRYVDTGTYTELRMYWLRAKLLQRLGELDDSLKEFENARAGINAHSVGMDQALLMVDLAELHLERADPAAARQLALNSFPILHELRANREAYRALRTLHRAAQDDALDSAVVSAVRDRLSAT